jgi:hypothetical protein
VDKFQGQEAAVVLYSMATSSRHLDFLYSRNRLNVAVSRARCFAVLLASPKLLDVQCRTPELMRALNAFCQLLASRGVAGDARTTLERLSVKIGPLQPHVLRESSQVDGDILESRLQGPVNPRRVDRFVFVGDPIAESGAGGNAAREFPIEQADVGQGGEGLVIVLRRGLARFRQDVIVDVALVSDR